MEFESLTFKCIQARPVVLKLERPVIARIATITDWPLILIDLYTEEGVVGRSYLEPYIPKSMRYLIPALHDLGEMLKGRRIAPLERFCEQLLCCIIWVFKKLFPHPSALSPAF